VHYFINDVTLRNVKHRLSYPGSGNGCPSSMFAFNARKFVLFADLPEYR
jgi:hypothetical protein